MLSETGASPAIVALFDKLYPAEYCEMATSALFIYESIVTFDREVAHFWTAKRTGASLLFFTNKWISIIFYVMLLGQFSYFPSDKSCTTFELAEDVFLLMQFLPVAAFSSLRAFVLSRNMLLGLLVLALNLAPVGSNMVTYVYGVSGRTFRQFRCIKADHTTATESMRLVLISRVPLIVADCLLIYITWTKLSSRHAMNDIRRSKKLSLSDILFRDGTVYFVVMFVLNVLHLTFSLTGMAQTASAKGSYMTIFTGSLTAIIISRFLLDLQEANQMVVRLDNDDPLHSSRNAYDSTPSFISSLGAFINPDMPAPSDDGSELDGGSAVEVQEETAVASSSA